MIYARYSCTNQSKINIQNKQLTIKIFSRGATIPTPHGIDVYPVSAAGNPWTASYIAAKGDPIANLQEDLAADVATLNIQHQ